MQMGASQHRRNEAVEALTTRCQEQNEHENAPHGDFRTQYCSVRALGLWWANVTTVIARSFLYLRRNGSNSTEELDPLSFCAPSERAQGFTADPDYWKGEVFAYVGRPQNLKDLKD